jgi:hypothetical protein
MDTVRFYCVAAEVTGAVHDHLELIDLVKMGGGNVRLAVSRVAIDAGRWRIGRVARGPEKRGVDCAGIAGPASARLIQPV